VVGGDSESGWFAPIEDVIDDIRDGKMVILVDDEDRENEGDLIMAAEKVTPEDVNFITKVGRGMMCVPLTPERLDKLAIPPMTERNTDPRGTAYTLTVDYRHGTTTGVSAYDRAATIQALVDERSRPDDFYRPGHTQPLIARKGGVLKRAGHTEATVDLARLAGLKPAGVLCEILSDDGTMARGNELVRIAQAYDLKVATIASLIKYRRRAEKLIQKRATARLPTKYGDFVAHAYLSDVDDNEYVAFVLGDITDGAPTLCRIHSSCVTGDLFESLRCDCGDQLHLALQKISTQGHGVLLYIEQEGRGIGLVNKMRAYELQDKGADTVQANQLLGMKADLRDYGIGAQILVDLGIEKMRYMTNNPAKLAGLEGYGIEIVEVVPLRAAPNPHNVRYLATKREKLGHFLAAEVLPSDEDTGADAA
jgi:3,4-dihydroxy 2-butanone 4-phosphate synthase/GTP cyclohydrolase II